MKTPIQEFKEYLFNTFDHSKDQDWTKQTVLFLDKLEAKERDFAEDCFIAGDWHCGGEIYNEVYGEGANTHPTFNDFYNQYNV